MEAMKRKLFGYMVLLAALLVFAVVTGLFLIGRFSDARAETFSMLDLHLSVFEKEVSVQSENMAAAGIQMSEKMTQVLTASLEEQNLSFSDLNDSEEAIRSVQESLFEPLRQFLLRSGCSGAFVILDATVNSSAKESADSRTGLYLELGGSTYPENVLLYRGISGIGKQHGVLPHRKWRLEFRTNSFPGYQKVLSSGAALEHSCCFSRLITLPGTSEKAVLLLLPVKGPDGNSCGVCGFEISQSLFKTRFSQPSRFSRMTLLLDPGSYGGSVSSAGYAAGYAAAAGSAASGSSASLDGSACLSSGIAGGYYEAVSGKCTLSPAAGNLLLFTGADTSYIGISRTESFLPEGNSSALYVLIPKADYDSTVRRNWTAMILLVLLLVFFAVTVSLFFSRRFLSPIHREITEIRAKQAASAEEAVKIKQDLERLAPKVRNEIDDDSYAIFKENLKKLTPKEKEVFGLVMSGHSSKEITEIEGFTINALKYHNRNIYSKLGVSSKKELLKYSTLVRREGSGTAPLN